MKQYDVKCPLCGTMNRSLYLDETDGWMECEHCHETVRVQEFIKLKKIPVFNMRWSYIHFLFWMMKIPAAL